MKIFLLDSNSIICRYFFAMPEMFDSNGINVSALFGYCRLIQEIIKNNQNHNIAIIATFDRCYNNFRKKIDSNYKANRKRSDSSLVVQLNLAEEFCKKILIPVEYHSEYEADDIIGSIATKMKHQNKEINIISTDKDLLQLIDSNVFVINPFKKIKADEDYVLQKYGINAKDFDLFLALCGDASDNIQGIQNVGPKTAVKIINTTTKQEEMQQMFPKYDFSNLPKMLELTKLYLDYDFNKINKYKTDIVLFNQTLRLFDFKTIDL